MHPGGAIRGKASGFGGRVFSALKTSHLRERVWLEKDPGVVSFKPGTHGRRLSLGLRVNGRQELQFVPGKTFFNVNIDFYVFLAYQFFNIKIISV